MSDERQARPRLLGEAEMLKGVDLERAGGVRSAVFCVEAGDDRLVVYETRGPDDAVRLACSCPAQGGCEHVAAVLAHLTRLGGQMDPPCAPQEGSDAERVSWISEVGLHGQSIAPAGPEPVVVSALYHDRDAARAARDTIRAMVTTLATRGLEEGHATLVDLVADLERRLAGRIAMDVVRPSAQLRDAILARDPDPGRMAVLLERMRAVLAVLDEHVDGTGAGADLDSSYLGRSWSFDEAQRLEDMTLLEVARTTVRTPFGLRRGRSYLLDLDSGRTFVELSHEGLDEATTVSVGPFPRRIHAGLMMTMPGIPPAPLRLLQYVILPAPTEGDLLKLKKYSLDTVREAYAALTRVVSVARAPYGAFVMFGPAHVDVVGESARLVDGEGAILALAGRVDAPSCEALAIMSTRGRVHCVMGHMLWTGHEIALCPVSVLVENSQGLSLLRLR